MQLRAVIIDDEQSGIDALSFSISRYIPLVTVVASTNEARNGINLIESYRPEIVFLDINMPEMTGFEMLEELKWNHFNLVFTTAHEEYGLRALKKNAVDYLLKPVDPEDLNFTVNKIINNLKQSVDNHEILHPYNELLSRVSEKQKNKLLLNLRTGIEAIDVNEIIYLKSLSNYTQIFLSNRTHLLASKNLKEFDIQLCRNHTNFMRVHNSFIANLNKVVRYYRADEIIVMNDGEKIPIARAKKEFFHSWLNI